MIGVAVLAVTVSAVVLLAAPIEGRVGGIGGVMALGADEVGTLELDRPHDGEDRFGSEFLVVRGASTATGNRALFRLRSAEQLR